MRRAPIDDTIFALSSGRLPSGVAVLRLSGSQSFTALKTLVGDVPAPRAMALRPIRSMSGDLLDRGLVAVFPGPSSFTGEDCAELHLHGGRAVVAAVCAELGLMPGLRPADAGEFSRRAFQNGKIDLTQAEALADLIDAETEAQRRFAIGNSSGRNAALYGQWRETLLTARAMIEAELDFPDEDDVPGSVADQAWSPVARLVLQIDRHLKDYRRAEILREGYRVAIIGAPNAGKSSLLNALARRDVAIVSEEPGTTRDVIEVALDLDGIKVILTDTAGLRENAGSIETQGMERAKTMAGLADLILLVQDGSDVVAFVEAALPASVPIIRVRSKIDLISGSDSRETPAMGVSTLTGAGLPLLVDLIARKAAAAAGTQTDLIPFRERHVVELRSALAALEEFTGSTGGPIELAAEHLRVASVHLARIIGTIDVEDMLDVVFSRFCIGK